MNGPIAQIVALVCHGNAKLRGLEVLSFFPDNSTCKDCESIRFLEFKSSLFSSPKEKIVASLPDLWFSELTPRGIKGLRLGRAPGPDPGLSGLLAMAAIGNSNGWAIEAELKNGKSEFWQPKWKILDNAIPEKREWRVTYTVTTKARTEAHSDRPLSEVKDDLRKTLEIARDFADKYESCTLFGVCFTKACLVLDDPSLNTGYYKDLAPEGGLSADASALLQAAMNAWVFGGGDSWNGLKFIGEERKEYIRVSQLLIASLNSAITAAATSTRSQ
jgi:hypothetical protein